VQHDGLRHQAFVYADQREFLAGAAAFIRAGVSAGQPILVAVDAAKAAALRTLVDDGHDNVQYADMAALGRNPAGVIPLLQGFIDQHNTTSAGLRGICETVWADRRPEELVECRRSELLLNVAFSDAAGFWVLCPYDSSTLERIVIDDAYLTIPSSMGPVRAMPGAATKATKSPRSSTSPFPSRPPVLSPSSSAPLTWRWCAASPLSMQSPQDSESEPRTWRLPLTNSQPTACATLAAKACCGSGGRTERLSSR
jgi:MEDS: MEthanogen/methylotroph, DcmR Sensory domain